MYERTDIQQYLASRVARPSSAGVIVEDNTGRALVLKAYYKSYWAFPGGWVDDEQTPPQAAVRELLEETALSVDESSLTFAYVINRKSDIMQTYQFLFRTSHVRDDSEAITMQADEIDAFAFVAKSEVLADVDNYGLAVVLWAQDDQRGYVEQQLEMKNIA